MGYVPFVAFKVYEMSVHVGVFKLFVAKDILDEFDVFGSVVFHGCFPMSECVRVSCLIHFLLETNIPRRIEHAVAMPKAEPKTTKSIVG